MRTLFTSDGKTSLDNVLPFICTHFDFSLPLTSGSAGLVRNESSEIEVFAAKDLDFAIDDEGKVTIILGKVLILLHRFRLEYDRLGYKQFHVHIQSHWNFGLSATCSRRLCLGIAGKVTVMLGKPYKVTMICSRYVIV